MKEINLHPKLNLNEQVNNFLFHWHRFTIDYWWRKRYNVPFGSSQHREMNPIDMLIEYKETLEINKANIIASNSANYLEEDEEELSERKTVPVSQKEMDEDYEDLDLEQFNIKNDG